MSRSEKLHSKVSIYSEHSKYYICNKQEQTKMEEKMKTLYWISTIVTLFLGIGHIFFTPVFYDEFNIDAVWFITGGLSLVYLGIINIIAIKSPGSFTGNASLISNLLGNIYIILIITASPNIEIQAIIALISLLLLTVSSFFHKKSS